MRVGQRSPLPLSLSLSFPYPSTEKVEFHEGETYHPTVSIRDGAKRAAKPLGRRLALSAEQLKKKRYARREDAVLSTGRVIGASKTDWSIDTLSRETAVTKTLNRNLNSVNRRNATIS